MTDLYQTLGTDKSASADQVKRAYRRKAKTAHPDTPTGSSEAFQKITRAYLVLSDPARRSKYDATGDIDEQTVDNTLSQAVSVIVGAVMSAVDGYVKGGPDPSVENLPQLVSQFVKRNIVEFEKQEALMKKAQASLKDIAKRWTAKKKAAFLKTALDAQAAATQQPLARIHEQIETYKLALELLANSSFDSLQKTAERYQPDTRFWKSVYTSTT